MNINSRIVHEFHELHLNIIAEHGNSWNDNKWVYYVLKHVMHSGKGNLTTRSHEVSQGFTGSQKFSHGLTKSGNVTNQIYLWLPRFQKKSFFWCAFAHQNIKGKVSKGRHGLRLQLNFEIFTAILPWETMSETCWYHETRSWFFIKYLCCEDGLTFTRRT